MIVNVAVIRGAVGVVLSVLDGISPSCSALSSTVSLVKFILELRRDNHRGRYRRVRFDLGLGPWCGCGSSRLVVGLVLPLLWLLRRRSLSWLLLGLWRSLWLALLLLSLLLGLWRSLWLVLLLLSRLCRRLLVGWLVGLAAAGC